LLCSRRALGGCVLSGHISAFSGTSSSKLSAGQMAHITVLCDRNHNRELLTKPK
jgi:hypothetical protein